MTEKRGVFNFFQQEGLEKILSRRGKQIHKTLGSLTVR